MKGLMIGILVALVLALIVLIAIAASRNYDRHRHHHPHNFPYPHFHRDHVVTPWCSHLRYGCCPGTTTPKVDRHGSNCRLY